MFMSAWVLGNYDFSLVWIVFLAVGLLAIQLIAVKRKVQKRVINHANTFYDNPNPEKESMYWVNNLIKTIWINFPKTMEEQIILNANAAIEPNKPAFLEELCVEACSVGSYYPQLSNFRVWNESMEALKFDCEMSYESDFKLELKIKKGISIPIKLKNVTFKSALRLFLRFLPNDQRYVCYAWVSLLEPLEIDMSIQIFGIDVTEFPFIMWIVRRLIRDLSNEIMLVPNRVGLDLAAMQAFTPTISQLKPQPRPEDYNTNMFSSYANMSNAGLSAVKGVGHIGGSAVKGVGNVGVGAVKGVGNVGVGAVKGLGHVGKGAAGMAGSMSSSMIGINKKKKEKLSDNELLVEEEEHPADNKVPSSLQELPTESSSLSPDRPKKQKRSMSFTQKIFGHKHKDKKNDDIDE
ncbi:hypothetical protein SARC_04365 [Sphaeroforma arctica JP610]|uniref:SMP-LTD domain-containing protein n=1 Tax=Sphaeroforma arctica JP610 TaxID=667725 RepID=A0A0L0G539_9EUKA|nr:hypothetical protein SARC_04365 [Sphaeroforma arctica JP610]KNC83378.1 hypothetical protein SARC_04365 [Sphaeroforma arctica JP610]|eukprot:XP_014157280.1 hypothetical protein SARC_04365 [Sphaeroforma arctica JP610]